MWLPFIILIWTVSIAGYLLIGMIMFAIADRHDLRNGKDVEIDHFSAMFCAMFWPFVFIGYVFIGLIFLIGYITRKIARIGMK